MMEDRQKCLDEGMDRVLIKPFDPAILHAAIEAVARGQAGSVCPPPVS
jgi:DNA-binding response OmpR family regulator